MFIFNTKKEYTEPLIAARKEICIESKVEET
jgi:hypothetical protein